MKVYGTIVLSAILILANEGLEMSSSQAWGTEKLGDKTATAVIKKRNTLGFAVYNATIRMPTQINYVGFKDISSTAASVWISKPPPFTEAVITIVSSWRKGFHFNLTVYYA